MDVEIGFEIIERFNSEFKQLSRNTCIPDLGNMFQNCRKNDLDHHFEPVKAPMSPQSYTFITILVMCLICICFHRHQFQISYLHMHLKDLVFNENTKQ